MFGCVECPHSSVILHTLAFADPLTYKQTHRLASPQFHNLACVLVEKCLLVMLSVCRNRKLLFVVSEHPEENKRGDERGADSLKGFGLCVQGKHASLLNHPSACKCGIFESKVCRMLLEIRCQLLSEWRISYWINSVSHRCHWGQWQAEIRFIKRARGINLILPARHTVLYKDGWEEVFLSVKIKGIC